MPVSTVTNRVNYQGDGTSAVFAFQFPLFAQTDLGVFAYNSSLPTAQVVTPMSLNGAGGTGYVISGNTNPSGIYPNGVNVVVNSAPNAQTVMVIFRSSVVTNGFSVSQTGTIPSSGLNNELDYLTLLAQRHQDQITRSIRLHDGLGQSFDTTLPSNIATQPGKYLIVNSGGNGFVLGDNLGGGYIPNTVIVAASSSSISSLGGAQAGFVLQSNGSSAPSWAAVSLSGSSVAGTLTLGNGGTGGLVPQRWGVVFASSATQLATTDPAPVGLALISNASSAPTFQQLNLLTAVGSTLPTANGGLGAVGPYNQFGVLLMNTATAATSTSPGGGDVPLVGNAGAAPTFHALNLASGSSVTGVLPLPLGGTGTAGNFPQFAIMYMSSATQMTSLPAGGTGTVLTSQGSSAPAWTSPLTNPMTTLGDIIVGGAAGATTRLAGSVSNSSAFLVQTGSGAASAAPVWTPVKPPKVTILSSSGVFTPDAGVIALRVIVTGAGGGGGGTASTAAAAGAGAGGGGGGTAIKWFSGAGLLPTFNYVVAAAPAGGTAGNNAGGTGSSSVFGSVVGAGGIGGIGSATSSAANWLQNWVNNGGAASGGDINLVGGAGDVGFTLAATQAHSGFGGGSYFSPQAPGNNNDSAGLAGVAAGGGGSGGTQRNNAGVQAGGAGGPGTIVIESYFP